jgi:two-component system, OmpR family, phosphate regulon response regulator PhoB
LHRILLIEDSLEYQILVSRAVSSSSIQVLLAESAVEALEILKAEAIDLILLDIKLPDRDGFQLYSELQALHENREVPVVFLTGVSELTHKVTAFSLGAEDFLVKPIQPIELRVRIESKLRKLTQKKHLETILIQGPLKIHSYLQKAYIVANDSTREKELRLTPTEFRILHYLVRNPEQVLSRHQILNEVWGNGSDVIIRTVDAHVSSLRKKMSSNSGLIESILGEGYRFMIPK